MAKKHPSEVTTEALVNLAQIILCPDWHRDQKYEKAAEWKNCIAMFLDEFDHQVSVKAEQKQRSTELEEARKRAQDDMVEEAKKNLALLKERIESSERELREERLECRESKDRFTAETDGLRLQLKDLQKSQTRNASEIPSLKGRLAETVSIVQALKEEETQKLSQITTLNERLAQSASTIRTLKETDAARLEDVGRLQTELGYKDIRSEQRETAHSQEVNELNKRLKASDLRFETLKTTSDAELSNLKQGLWNLEADAEENERMQRKAAETARQRLIDSNALIEKLKVTSSKGTASLLRELKDSNQALLETKNQLSQLKQQNQKLKTREYLGAFCLLNKQRRCEHAERECVALSEQLEQLEKQLAAAGEQLAVQNVRKSPEICKRISH